MVLKLHGPNKFLMACCCSNECPNNSKNVDVFVICKGKSVRADTFMVHYWRKEKYCKQNTTETNKDLVIPKALGF